MSVTGYVHSIETCGTVDGPGVRFVVFLQGCHLRCLYCHNVDTWKMKDGEKHTSDQIVKQALRYRSYMKASKGGITISGGEPLLQADFVAEVFSKIKRQGIHTAIDTSGQVNITSAKKVLDHTDLVLLDLKAIDPLVHKKLVGADLEKTLEFASYLNAHNIPTWIRHVLVPGYTDNPKHLEKMGAYIASMSCIERVDILPFHKLGEYKWSQMNYEYTLKDTPPPTDEQLAKAYSIFSKYNLPIPASHK